MTRTMLLRLAGALVLFLTCSLGTFAQVSSTSAISGSVTDPSGAVVPNATVTVRNSATGAEFKATTAENGTFSVPALTTGTYTVMISARGFKQAIVEDVKLDAGTPSSVNVNLEVGAQSESVVVQGAGEVLQTQTANISTTITGRQITDLPFTSRDALDLVLLLPGTSTPGRPRTSTINGLPKGALNITLDGVNVQDNNLKSSDGFFTYIRPRIDAIDEVTVSTATPGAESAGEGAVQLKFVTRSGNNEFHGSVYEYHRNPALYANYWFNNRDLAPDPSTGKAPRDRILLNQFGFRVGGPIIRDRAFFFANFEEYRLPEQVSRTRTILSPLAQAGVYQYVSSSGLQQKDLLALAAANGQTSTIDPMVGSLLSEIRKSTTTTGGVNPNINDPNLQAFSFTNVGGQTRYFPTIRLDFNLTSKHHLENIWNYQKFAGVVDFLNNVDPAFPNFPNHGSQISNRFSEAIALRSTLTPTLVNEARFGLTGGSLLFFPEVNGGQFTNQGGYSINMNTALGITNATVTRAPSRRNSPVWQLTDTVNWTHGAHNLAFGFSFTQINLWSNAVQDGVVRSLTLNNPTNDPAGSLFTTANFPGASTTQLTQARALYNVLIGRITSATGTLALDEKSGQYSFNGNLVQRARQRETGVFAQDTWRFRPNLTLTGGLRWEVEYPFTPLNQVFSQTSYAGLFGISGPGNEFKPGTTAGSVTQYTPFDPGNHAYNTQYGNFAPSLGIAWSPSWTNKAFRRIFGENGESVIRAGYSIAYNREGTNVLQAILGSNPGGTLSVTQSIANTTLPTSGVLLRNGIPPLTGLPAAPSFPITSTVSFSANGFLPDLKTGYVQSWTLGWQRELNKDTVIEARYVGNRGVKLWRQYNVNEVNLVENGFYNEYKLALANLIANKAAGGSRAGSFAYFGPSTGTAPLPILLGFFNGLPAAQAGDQSKYTSSSFRNTTFTNLLDPVLPNAISFATNIYQNPASFAANGVSAGLPRNFFVVNPDVSTALGGTGGSFLVDNSGRTSYDALVIELRRRLSRGLLVQGSYAFARAFTNMFASSSSVFSQYTTLRDPGRDKTPSPFGITHGLKLNWIYELPIGRGKALLGDSGGVLNQIFGGWEFHGTARIQSGNPFDLGNVNLINMTKSQLQDALQVRKEPNRIAYYLPQDIIDNTRKAYGSIAGTPDPNGRYIAPAYYNNPQAFAGQNGFAHVVLYGPHFTRFDLSAVKKFKITERINFEFRAEFLNAFNNINFIIGNPANDVNSIPNGAIGSFTSATFGQITQAYRDTSTTNDPGGRMIQFVARINF
jgi:hypothetical protein